MHLPSRLVVAVALTPALLLLAGCAGGSADGGSTAGGSAAGGAADGGSGASADDRGLSEVGAALAGLGLGPDPEVTPDGEQFALGDPAVLRVATAQDPTDPTYRELLLATTVVEIAELDRAGLRALDLPQGTAYLVRLDHQVVASEGNGEGDGVGYGEGDGVVASERDGEPADVQLAFVGIGEDSMNLPTQQAGVGDQAIGECEAVPFDSLGVGGVGRSCIVAVAPEGGVVGGAAWSGDPVSDGSTPDTNPFLISPIMWRQ